MDKKILLIDDDQDEFYIFEEALVETPGVFTCNFANSVEDGLASLSQSLPDFIFLDINMPRISGFEALAMIKKAISSTPVPVVMYSTAINDEVKKKALALGASACIRKTDTVRTLADSLMKLFHENMQLPLATR